MAKIVQLSDDSESNWYTLPGNSGAFNNESSPITDTVFGQDYQSEEIGLIDWSVEAQAFYKGFAGYVAKLKKQGTPTAMTTEAMSLVSGKTYKIDDAAKEIWDHTAAFTVFDNAVDETANVETFNYLFGEVTFLAAYTPNTPITITGTYLPMTTLGAANAFTLTQTAETIESSDFATVQANNGFRTFQQGLKTVSLDLSSFYAVASGFRALLQGRTETLIEVDPDGNGKSVARGFFKAVSESQSGDVGALEDESTTFTLNVPSSDFIPFGWEHANDTTLHTSIQVALTSWLDATEIDVQYLHDGTNGIKGGCIITDVTLSGGLDNMNEFNVTCQGTGATTNVGAG